MIFVPIGLAALAAGVGGHQIWRRWVAKKQKEASQGPKGPAKPDDGGQADQSVAEVVTVQVTTQDVQACTDSAACVNEPETMEQDVRTFLKRFSSDELENLGVLQPYGARYLLRSNSVDPLIELMKGHTVTRLVAGGRHWFLTSDGEFSNPGSTERRQGSVADLRNPGNVFTTQNLHINPYFNRSQPTQESPSDEDDQAEPVSTQVAAKSKAAQESVHTTPMDRVLVSNLQDHIKEVEEENVRLENKLEKSESTIIEMMADLDQKISQATQVAAEAKEIQKAVQIALGDHIKGLELAAAFPHLKFGPDAERDYANLSGKDSKTVINKLKLLDESALEWHVNGGTMPSWKCDASDESKTVKDNPKLRDQRLFMSYHGDKRYFMWHTSCGKRRIHFRFDGSKPEVEIGYIGKHLETALFP